MTLLDDIISASTDSSVATPDLLRKVQVVAHRLGATTVEQWVKWELGGYPSGADLPPYRVLETNVMGHFSGPMHSWREEQLSTKVTGLEALWKVQMDAPLLELGAFAEGEGDPQRTWSAWNVQQYKDAGGDGIIGMNLFSAWNVITRQSLKGVIDLIRSKALEFALDLQDQYPNAGEPNGPTVASVPDLAKTVINITNNITGHGTNIAAGTSIAQRSKVDVGDVDSLRNEVKSLGVSEADIEEFVAALVAERDLSGARTKGFIEKVKSGAITVGASIASDVAASSLIALAEGFLGLVV